MSPLLPLLITASPAVVVLPPELSASDAIEDSTQAAIERVFADRLLDRMSQLGFRTLAPAMAEMASVEPCEDRSCFEQLVRTLRATHWTRLSVLPSESGCVVTGQLFGLASSEPVRRFQTALERCELDGLLVAVGAAADALAQLPSVRPRTDTALSAAPVRDLEIPNIEDIALRSVRSSTTARRFPLERALAIYGEQHIQAARDDSGKLRFIQNQQLLSECELRATAGAELTGAQREFCSGNAWLWALLGAPAGAALAAISIQEVDNAPVSAFAGVSVGLLGGLTAAVLGLTKHQSAHDSESGEYLSTESELLRVAAAGNAALREELGLSLDEVRWLAER